VVAKQDADKYELKPGKEVKVDNTDKLTEPEKQAVEGAIKEANPDAPIKTIKVDDKGKATVTYNDNRIDEVQGNVVAKQDADKYELKPGKEVKVDNTDKLTEPEKQAVEGAIKEANPDAPIKTIKVDDKGKATVTFNDDSTGEVQGNVVAKQDADKYTPNVPTTKVPVGDVNNLTDEEKGQVKTNVENANPDLPSGAEVTIGNDGTATIKYSDNSTDTIAGNKLVVAKPDTSTEQKVNLPDSKIEVSDPNHLTDEEKQQVKDKVAKSNPDAKDITVGDNGDTDVSFKNGNYGHVRGDQLVVKSNDSHDNTTDADKHPAVVPGTKVEVADPSHLTDEEKQQVKDNVAKSNPDAKDIKVSDNGDTTLIYNVGSENNLYGNE